MDNIFRNALTEEDDRPQAVLISVFENGCDEHEKEASLAELERLEGKSLT